MSEQSKHTPGPWNIIEGKTLIHIETDAQNPVGAGIPICSIPKSEIGNANLIYAAPDLLEAVKLHLAFLKSLPDGWLRHTTADIGLLNDAYCASATALAKAKSQGRTL